MTKYVRINRNSLRQFMKSRQRVFFRSRWIAPIYNEAGEFQFNTVRTATYRRPANV